MAAILKEKPAPVESKNYKGFVAGVFSGIAKLTGTCYSIPTPATKKKVLAAQLTDWKSFQSAIHLIQSKSASRPQTPRASPGPYNVFYRPSGMKACTASIKAQHRPLWDGCSVSAATTLSVLPESINALLNWHRKY